MLVVALWMISPGSSVSPPAVPVPTSVGDAPFAPDGEVGANKAEVDPFAEVHVDYPRSLHFPVKDEKAVTPPYRVADQNAAHEFTATVNKDGTERHFRSDLCEHDFTIRSLTRTFAAHSVEWSIFGKDNAWWSVLTGINPNAPITARMKTNFYNSGAEHVNMVLTMMKKYGNPPDSRGAVMDFGCGLGRLAFNFAKTFKYVSCVDQSMHHLRQAKEEYTFRKEAGWGEVSFDISTPDLLAGVGGARFDLVHTVIAMQHMVSPLQTVYIEQFCDVLKLGGNGWMHIPSYIPKEWPHGYVTPCDLWESRTRAGMQMHYTPAEYIQRTLKRRGCDSKVLEKGDWGTGGVIRNIWVLFTKTGSPSA
jgi:SAM-dependent methyltransferase